MAEVELIKLTKRFGPVVAVDGIDLTVEHGHLVALLGPSGCGKTTTLRMIGGLEQEDAGDILIEGRSMARVPPWERNLGFMFQNYALFPHMRVSENIAYGLRLRKWARDRINRRIEEVSSFLAIGGLLDRYPRQLSGGQQQRVALARAMAIEPRLLLMDEPLTGLDAKLREQVRFELKGIQRAANLTVIYVTHDQEEAFTLADKVVVMNQGRIEQTGSPAEIYQRPATAFVAEFIGSNNTCAGQIVDVQGQSVIVRCDGLTFRAPFSSGAQAGTDVAVIVRMGQLQLDPAGGDESGVNSFVGTVIAYTFVGSIVRIAVDMEGTILRVDQDAKTAAGRFSVGDRVHISVQDQDVQYFASSK